MEEEATIWSLDTMLDAQESFVYLEQRIPPWSTAGRFSCSCPTCIRDCICVHSAWATLLHDHTIIMPVSVDKRRIRRRPTSKKRGKRFVTPDLPKRSSHFKLKAMESDKVFLIDGLSVVCADKHIHSMCIAHPDTLEESGRNSWITTALWNALC